VNAWKSGDLEYQEGDGKIIFKSISGKVVLKVDETSQKNMHLGNPDVG
jgi:acetamidase/formamidase